MKNIVVKETAKEKATGTKHLMGAIKEAKVKKEGSFLGIMFKTIGRTIILM
jgi:hypothetical protein